MPADEDDRGSEPGLTRPKAATIEGPLPGEVRVIFAERLSIEKAGLPSPLLAEIKRIAAFQNPEFYKRQRLRLSTTLTPRIIGCGEELPDHLAIPRGLMGDLEDLLQGVGVRLMVDDEREDGSPVDLRFRGKLGAEQEDAAKALLAHEIGVLVAPPGAGKTVIGAYLAAARGRSTLVLVHRKPLLEQWAAQLSSFLGLAPGEVGRLGAGTWKATARLDVAMLQSLARVRAIGELLSSYGHVIVDECHHLPAVSFERILSAAKARYVLGLTATPCRRDGQHPIIQMQCGPTRYAIGPRGRPQRQFARRLIRCETAFATPVHPEMQIQSLYAALACDETRNARILDDVISAIATGRSPIVLSERRDHVEYLAEKLRGFTRHLVVLHGGLSAKDRRRALADMSAIPSDGERCLVATGRYVGEGFDDPRLDTLFLALPVAWKGTLVQYAGRLHRSHAGKSEVRIYDYVDERVPVLARMFEKRLRGYRALGYRQEGALAL